MKALTISAFVILVALTAQEAWSATKIYKTVDKDGNVIFSDVPPSNKADSPVQLQNTNQFSTPVTTQPAPQTEVDQVEEAVADAEAYQAIIISTPSNDEAIRENAGNLTVSVNLVPALKEGDSVQIVVNGAVIQSAQATTVALQNIDRGSHQMFAQVVDDGGNVVISSAPVTFHMLRYSRLN